MRFRHPQFDRRARRGLETLELIVALPVLILTTLAGLQFCLTLAVEQTLRAAATEAAREAGKGADIADIRAIIEAHLADHGVPNIANANSGVAVWLDRDGVMNDAFAGDNMVPTTLATDSAVGGQVRIVLVARHDALPAPDLLATFGFTLADSIYEESSLVLAE